MKVGSRSGASEEVLYRVAPGRAANRAGIRILHLAEMEQNYERALCGKRRDKPLDPGAQGEVCVVCEALYFRKHGVNWGESL